MERAGPRASVCELYGYDFILGNAGNCECWWRPAAANGAALRSPEKLPPELDCKEQLNILKTLQLHATNLDL
ncbi:hypothetical protein P43SY_003251 [Pythium insidiosum]|uniref:Uncharacterized protein n=1 Tax=Pythium insidiosum TaxID=114742 RepID=A0AAD5LCA6_PYTIN|nr:hypothetical protein P43SY_003251 [Pythium insidiosum]